MRSWVGLAGCFAMGTGFNAYLIAPASVSPLLVSEFDIGTSAVGLAISAVFLGWVVAGIPGGYLTDRHDNRRLVLAGVGVFVAAAWPGVTSTSYLGFLALRFVAGLTGAFLWTANTNVDTRKRSARRSRYSLPSRPSDRF